MSQQPVPTALVTPTGAELWHEDIPPAGLNAKGGGVAIGTAIALWKQIEEKDGRENRAEDKESTDDEDAQNGI
jgi:hypothetical protein